MTMITQKQEVYVPALKSANFTTEERENLFQMPNSYYAITNGSDFFYKFSPNWCELLGYSYEDLLKTSYFSLIHPEDLKDTMAITLSLNARSSQMKSVKSYTNRFFTKDKRIIWLQWSSKSSPNGLIYSQAIDITSVIQDSSPKQSLKTKDQMIEEFTEMELQIFSFLMEHEGLCVSKQDLYRHLYGNIVVQDQTINVHISNLRKKIKGSAYTLKTAGKGCWKILNKFDLLS